MVYLQIHPDVKNPSKSQTSSDNTSQRKDSQANSPENATKTCIGTNVDRPREVPAYNFFIGKQFMQNTTKAD